MVVIRVVDVRPHTYIQGAAQVDHMPPYKAPVPVSHLFSDYRNRFVIISILLLLLLSFIYLLFIIYYYYYYYYLNNDVKCHTPPSLAVPPILRP